MKAENLPDDIQEKLGEWLNDKNIIPSHYWWDGYTFYIIVRLGKDVYCIRIWRDSHKNIFLSQDNVLYGTSE